MPFSDHDLLAPADALAAYLATVDGLSGIDAIVARQKDLATEIDIAVAKESGAAILIALDGWANLIPDSSGCAISLLHSISLWTCPIYRIGMTPEAELLGLLVAALQRYTPDPADCGARWESESGRYIEHPTHRIYEFTATIHHSLPAVDLVE